MKEESEELLTDSSQSALEPWSVAVVGDRGQAVCAKGSVEAAVQRVETQLKGTRQLEHLRGLSG